MGQRQTVTDEERDRAMGITPEMVPCDGCPATEMFYVVPGRPGHMESCAECSRHCQCWKNPIG